MGSKNGQILNNQKNNLNMKKIALIIALITTTSFLFSQNIIMNETPDSLYNIPKWGKNRAHYMHLYWSFGMVVGSPSGDSYILKYGNSNSWKFGFRYKRKISSNFAVGFDASIATTQFRFAQQGSNVFPDSLMHDKEFISLTTFEFDYYNRINIGKRGDKVGKYIDLGAYVTSNIGSYHIYTDKFATPFFGSKKMEVKLSDLNYLNDYQWGFKTRIGNNRYAIWSSYRMSDYFNNKAPKGIELPRMMIGLELGLF